MLWVEHLVGDLHQPLHVGDDGDRGGNEVQVVYPASGRYPLNLHSEWDRVLVDDAIHAMPGGVGGLAAAAAAVHILVAELWLPWARESWELARTTAYRMPRSQSRSCGGGSPPVEIDEVYRAAAVPAVQHQLEWAGSRLAAVLNSVLR